LAHFLFNVGLPADISPFSATPVYAECLTLNRYQLLAHFFSGGVPKGQKMGKAVFT